MTTQGLLSGKTVWIVFAAYFLFLIAIARYTTWKEKRDAGKVDLQGGRFKWPVMVMTYIASCMSVWVFFAGPGAYYRYGLGYFFSEMCIYSMFPIICYFTMTKVWLVNQQKHFTTPADFFFCRYKSKALTVIIDMVYIICAVPFISAVLVAGGRAAEVATGGAVSSQTFTLICGIIMTVFVMLGGVKSTALADAVQGWFFILALWAIIFVTLKIVFNGSIIEAFQTVRVQTPDWFSYPGPIGICTYPSRVSYPLACAFGYTLLLPQVFVRSGYYSAGLKDQRQMAFLAPFLQIIVWGGTMLIGLVALAAMPNLTSSETELVIPYMCNIIAGTHGLLAQILMIVFLIGVLAVHRKCAADGHVLYHLQGSARRHRPLQVQGLRDLGYPRGDSAVRRGDGRRIAHALGIRLQPDDIRGFSGRIAVPGAGIRHLLQVGNPKSRYHLDFGRCDHYLPDLLRLGSRLCVVRHDRSGDRVRADVCGLQADKG